MQSPKRVCHVVVACGSTYIELLSSWATLAAALPLADEVIRCADGGRLGNLGRLLCWSADGGLLRSGGLWHSCLRLLFGHCWGSRWRWRVLGGDKQSQKAEVRDCLGNGSSADREGALRSKERASQRLRNAEKEFRKARTGQEGVKYEMSGGGKPGQHLGANLSRKAPKK